MAETKLRIDTQNGIIEVEGDEKFVKEVYADYKVKVLGLVDKEISNVVKRPKKIEVPPKSNVGTKKRPSGGSISGTIVKDLNLSGNGKIERLKDFYGKYIIKMNLERNLVFIYYLQQKMGLKNITIDHVFTCYRDIGVKVPKALQQSLWDTTNRKGWLDTSSSDNITVTVPGLNYIEHDLKKVDGK